MGTNGRIQLPKEVLCYGRLGGTRFNKGAELCI
jgi:hypothetical protein